MADVLALDRPARSARRRRPWSTRLGLLAAAVMLLTVLTACGGGNDSGSETSSGVQSDTADSAGAASDDAMEESEAAMEDADSGDRLATGASKPIAAPAAAQADDSPADAPTQGGVNVPSALQPIDIGRDIIFTAAMEVEADDVGLAAEEALRAVAPLGGLLFGQDTTSTPEPRTTLTIKVLPKDFQEALRLIGGVGSIRSQEVSTTDVTERVVNLESQISTAQTSVGRLRELLAGAVELDDVAQLEAQLLDRETKLELLRGQLRTIRDQVGLATIVVTIIQTQPPRISAELELTQTLALGHDEGRACPGVEDELSADEGDELTICYQVENVGDAAVTDLTISDEAFGIRQRHVVTIGGGEGPLAPGATRSFYAETEVDRYDVRSDARVTAIALRDGVKATDEPVRVDRTSILLDARPNDALPGFVDSMKTGGRALQGVIGVLVVILGTLLPFIWLIALLAAGWWWLRRRRATRQAEKLEAARVTAPPQDPAAPTTSPVAAAGPAAAPMWQTEQQAEDTTTQPPAPTYTADIPDADGPPPPAMPDQAPKG